MSRRNLTKSNTKAAAAGRPGERRRVTWRGGEPLRRGRRNRVRLSARCTHNILRVKDGRNIASNISSQVA
nr:MAG TPA: hypothetical protein [Inoviridae sp.]